MKRIALALLLIPFVAGMTSGPVHASATHSAVHVGHPTGGNIPCFNDTNCGHPNCGEGRPGCPPCPPHNNPCHCPPPGYNGGLCREYGPHPDAQPLAVPGTTIRLIEKRPGQGTSVVVVARTTVPHQPAGRVAFKVLAVGHMPTLALGSHGTLYQYTVRTGKTVRIAWITTSGIYEVSGGA